MSSVGPGLNAGDQGGSGNVKVLPTDGDTTSTKQSGDGFGSEPRQLSCNAQTTGTASGPSRKFG